LTHDKPPVRADIVCKEIAVRNELTNGHRENCGPRITLTAEVSTEAVRRGRNRHDKEGKICRCEVTRAGSPRARRAQTICSDASRAVRTGSRDAAPELEADGLIKLVNCASSRPTIASQRRKCADDVRERRDVRDPAEGGLTADGGMTSA
jgi:hypothetical protein